MPGEEEARADTPPAPPPTIEARDLTKRYGGIVALDGLSLQMPEGPIGFLGPNGAGKSTFLKILCGITLPSAGSCRLLGIDVVDHPVDAKQRLGYMPEFDCLPPDITAIQFVSHLARLSGLRKSDAVARTHEVLSYLRVGDERHRKLNQLSGGQRVKVRLAQAIVHNPGVLLLDEPTAGLDPWSRSEMLQLVQTIARRPGKTVILTTHILPDVEFMCDRVVVINAGKVIMDGEVAALTRRDAGFLVLRVRGAVDEFVVDLRERSLDVEVRKDELRIHQPKPDTLDEALRLAAIRRIQVRYASRGMKTLEEAFVELVQGEREKARGGSVTVPAILAEGGP